MTVVTSPKVVRVSGAGKRGESFADVARREGHIGSTTISGSATDQQVLDRLAVEAGTSATGAVVAARDEALAEVASASASITSILPGMVGGRRNLIPDPFFQQAVANKFTRSPTNRTLIQIGYNATLSKPRASSPFPDGKQLSYPGNTGDGFILSLSNMGLKAGDTFKIGIQLARSTGSLTSGDIMNYVFLDALVTSGGVGGGTVFTTSSGSPWDSTSRAFISPTMTVPADAVELVMYFPNTGAGTIYVDAIWMHAVDIPAAPTDIDYIPQLRDRLAMIEGQSFDRNNAMVRTVEYDSATVALQASSGTTAFVNNRPGFTQACLTSGFPSGGANAVRLALDWDVGINAATPLVFVQAEIRTRPITSPAQHPSAGRTVARGYITVDPNLGTAGLATILFHDVVTGLPKTVVPADLDETYCVLVWCEAQNGDSVTQMFIPIGVTPNKYSAFPSAWSYSGDRGDHLQWNSAVISEEIGMDLMLLVNPREVWNPSTSFASKVVASSDDLPNLSAVPRVVYGVQGRQCLTFWDNVELRPSRDTHMMVTGMPLTSVRRDGIRYTPSSAGTVTATVVPYRGGVASPSKTIQFRSVAPSAAAGTKAVLMFGDSLVRNGGVIDEMAAIDATDSVTNLAFIGTQATGSGKYMVGADGTSLGSYFGATLNGGITNPFYDSAGTHSFSFAHFLVNSTVAAQLSALGKTEPDFVFVEAGQNETGSALTDASALGLAGQWAAGAEVIVQNILAATTNTKVVIYTATPGPIETEGAGTEYPAGVSAVWRQRRNWIILAAQQIASFAGRESSRIYVTPCGSAIDPIMGWDNKSFVPRTQTLVRNSPADFATYATLSTSLAYAAGTIAKATDTGWYYIKMGPSGSGHWRSATVEDGFEWVENDVIHYGAYGAHCVAEAHWALIKNLG